MTLSEQLHRIAETAPAAAVPADTWTRARRARRRDLVITAGSVVTVLVLALGGLLWLPPQRLDPPVAGGADGVGVPDHLYRVPDRFTGASVEHGWTSGEVSTDVAVGPGAAAWLTPSSGLPVVVGAADGAYHLLDLPGFAGNNWFSSFAALHVPTIALSPDGRRLAYSWARFGPRAATEPIPSGIRVADLATGRVTTYPLPGAEGTMVERIVWSPDGGWLGWAGARLASWTRESMGSGTGAVGRIHLSDGTRQELLGNRLMDDSVGIDDAGALAYGDEGRLRFWDGAATTPARVAVSSGQRMAAGPGTRWAVPGVPTVTVVSGNGVQEARTSPDASRSVPLGWAGSEVVVLTEDDRGGGHLVLVRPGGAGRQVGEVDTAVDSLSVATDLMTADRPTVSRAAPDWPWAPRRWALVVAGPAAAVLLGGWVLLLRYRRRSAR